MSYIACLPKKNPRFLFNLRFFYGATGSRALAKLAQANLPHPQSLMLEDFVDDGFAAFIYAYHFVNRDVAA